jgi:hypothetical protein
MAVMSFIAGKRSRSGRSITGNDAPRLQREIRQNENARTALLATGERP